MIGRSCRSWAAQRSNLSWEQQLAVNYHSQVTICHLITEFAWTSTPGYRGTSTPGWQTVHRTSTNAVRQWQDSDTLLLEIMLSTPCCVHRTSTPGCQIVHRYVDILLTDGTEVRRHPADRPDGTEVRRHPADRRYRGTSTPTSTPGWQTVQRYVDTRLTDSTISYNNVTDYSSRRPVYCAPAHSARCPCNVFDVIVSP